MKTKFLFAIFFLYFISSFSLHAQWAKTYGGTGEDEAHSIQQTSDGGYIFAGMTKSFGDEEGDAWLIKIDPGGNIQWQKTYGENSGDAAYAITQTYDGGYVMSGAIAREGWGMWILKLDPDGEVEWQKFIKGEDYEYGVAYSVQQTTDGGYIAAGEFRYGGVDTDVWILKLTPDGTKEWDKTYGGNDPDHAFTLQQTSDGGIVVSGQNDRPAAETGGIWVLKLNSMGEILWQKTYAGVKEDEARSIQQTSDGGYIVVGKTSSFDAESDDIWMIKLDPVGEVEWQQTIGGEGQDYAQSVQQTSSGGYIVAGTTYSFGEGDGDIWVLRLDKNGDVEWQKTYGGYGKEEAYSIFQTYDGGYAVAGFTASYGAGEMDFIVMKLSPNGSVALPCDFENESFATIQKTYVSAEDTYVNPVDTNISASEPNITPKNSNALVYSICLGQHTLDLSASSGGTTDPQPGFYIYYHASRIKIRATPEEEYLFFHWSGDVESIENPLTITMDSDKSIKANFIENFEEIWEDVKKTPCFIATAAYESPRHPHVCILRDFKDEYLMTQKWGRKLVALYYRYSPSMAKFISTNKLLKFPVRHSLQPFVVVSCLTLTLGPVQTGLLFVVIVLLSILAVSIFRRKKNLFVCVQENNINLQNTRHDG